MNQSPHRRSHRRPGLFSAALLAAVVALASPAPAPAATPAEVNDAIKKAVAYLYATQKDGHWELVPKPDTEEAHDVRGRQWGGMTAIATYALLAAGENEQDPRIKKAVEWLASKELVGTYAVALRAQVWALLKAEGPYRALALKGANRDAQMILDLMVKKGAGLGYYNYYWDATNKKPAGPGNHVFDRSNSQYGVLGAWACAQAGAEIPNKYWQIIDAVWKKGQRDDGGWGYYGPSASTSTMTAAGVATLFISQDFLLGAKAECKGNIVNPELQRGLKWMDRNIGNALTSGNLYLMYGIERIGVAGGRKYFGTVDWYGQGSEWLVRHQNPGGSFGREDGTHNPSRVPGTAFALFFLTRGRAPVMMNKLEYASVSTEGGPTGWNQRPRDLANLTHWMTVQAEKYYNWQIVNLKVSADDLHDAPILYLAGGDTLGFKEPEIAKLRAYVEGGGIILGNADCGKIGFTKSFKELGRKLFPAYEFRQLEPNHPIFTNQQFKASRWKGKVAVTALGNGARELMLLVPDADVSRSWQLRSERTRDEHFQLAANVYLYAVDKKTSRFKGETYVVKDAGGTAAKQVKVARLQAAGNWDPEPGGWRRLANVLKNEHRLGLAVEAVKPGEGKLAGGDYALAHFTGTGKFTLGAEQRAEIRKFVQGGGTLVVDAAGGRVEFADAAEQELIEIFGPAAARQVTTSLPLTHPLYTRAGAKIEAVGYREFAKKDLTGKLPRLKGITVRGRTAVFFSREDLSVGMVGQDVDGVFGYEPASATALMRNVVLHALGGGDAPAAGGAPDAEGAPEARADP